MFTEWHIITLGKSIYLQSVALKYAFLHSDGNVLWNGVVLCKGGATHGLSVGCDKSGINGPVLETHIKGNIVINVTHITYCFYLFYRVLCIKYKNHLSD